MPKLIDGRAIAEKVYAELRRDIAELKAKGLTPGLAVVLVGDNPASRAYVRSKDKMCRELGLHSVKLELPASTTQTELLARVEDFNRDSAIHGILFDRRRPSRSTKRQSCARWTRERTWTDFTRKMSPSSCSKTRVVLCRAHRSACNVCFWKATSRSMAPTLWSSAAA